MNLDIINKSRDYAGAAHRSIKQIRKYSGEPYEVHVFAVQDLVSEFTNDTETIVAAVLHDVLEDVTPSNPTYSLESIIKEFGVTVGKYVVELTHIYTKEAYPDLNRAKRKNLELERLKQVSPQAKLIKIADIIDNIKTIVNDDPLFARVYLKEKYELLPFLFAESNEQIYLIANDKIKNELSKLV